MCLRMLFIILGLCCMGLPAANAQNPDRHFAPGFRQVESARGVTLFQKGKDYVQIIAPHRGGAVRLLYGEVFTGTGSTQFARRDLRDWWNEWSAQEPHAFTLMNSQFFDTRDAARAPLAFSTKADGVVYQGYGDSNEYPEGKMMLRIGKKSATVEPYDDNPLSLYRYPEPDIIVGLRPDINKQRYRRRGRTFIGAMPHGNLLIFTSPAATQRYAERILVAFGADWGNTLMLDGGGSTQLLHRNNLLIPRSVSSTTPKLRPIPQALGVVEGIDE